MVDDDIILCDDCEDFLYGHSIIGSVIRPMNDEEWQRNYPDEYLLFSRINHLLINDPHYCGEGNTDRRSRFKEQEEAMTKETREMVNRLLTSALRDKLRDILEVQRVEIGENLP